MGIHTSFNAAHMTVTSKQGKHQITNCQVTQTLCVRSKHFVAKLTFNFRVYQVINLSQNQFWMVVTARNEVGARLCFYTCLWFCSQGESAPLHAGIHPPGPEAGTPPGPEAGTPPPRSRHPPGPGTPPTSAVLAERYGQQAGGTHPTGMQSCVFLYLPVHIDC